MSRIDVGIFTFWIGVTCGILINLNFIKNRESFWNTQEYKVEEKLEIVGQDTTQYIRIIKK